MVDGVGASVGERCGMKRMKMFCAEVNPSKEAAWGCNVLLKEGC